MNKLKCLPVAITLILAHFAYQPVLAENPSGQIGVSYSLMNSSSQELNDARKSILWNSNNPSGGTIDQLSSISAEIGFSLYGPGLFVVQYNTGSQKLDSTAVIGTPATVTDSFNYDSVYLLYEYPITMGSWLLQIGGGVGKSLKCELHQKEGGGGVLQEDLTWKGAAIPYKAQVTFGYPIFTGLNFYIRAQYEVVSSELKAAQDYQTTINAQAIVSGQKLKNYSTDEVTNADLSGLRYGIGLNYLF